MFHVDPDEGAVILTDTLVTDSFGNPCLSTTKCRLFPHLNMVMAGTGSGNLLNAWSQHLMEGMLAVDVEMCSLHTPGVLRALWRDICDQHGISPIVGDPGESGGVSGRTATVYQFGQDRDGRFIWYVFRSYNDFEAELWDQGGFAVKPQPGNGFAPGAEAPATVAEMITLGVQIRAEQDAVPLPQRICIGGDLWLTSLTPDGIAQKRVYRFDDWSDQWEAMNRHLPAT